MEKTNSYRWPFILVTSLFFLWGFIPNLHPKLIPHLPKAYQLTTLQSSLVDSSVFIAYFLTVLPLIGIAFLMSIMFPAIFASGIKDLGRDTKIGSRLIIMSIVGGALLPPVLGYIADVTNNIQDRYIIPLFCFIILLFELSGHQPKPSV